MEDRVAIDRALAELHARGVGAWTAAPPAFRLLWRLGLFVPPPHFLGYWSLSLCIGLLYGVLIFPVCLWAVFYEPLTISGDAKLLAFAFLVAAGGGLFFGLAMALYLRWRASRLCLPSWKEFRASLGSAA